ncbi:MAG: 2-hydroxyacyl-CoA dehydratase family protein, partial [Proteobacteria bacterium]|nr:2-hydroxyacyl-CoA dehydratase family protein [Pseudomonadota bacterium]
KLRRFKERLEALTGVEITAERLKAAIELCNRERELFRGISLKRRAEPCPLPGREFMDLHHASYLLDKEIMIGRLEETLRGLDEPRHEVIGPRVMLTGSTLARGDFKAPDLVIEAGGRIVVEEFAEGLRPYWFEVDMEGDPLAALAEAYFMRRVPPAWFRPGRERLDFLVDLARDFNVDGVVWYQLMFRESYKIESGFFPDILRRETGLSMLVLESDYDDGETGAMRTRIETYMQTIGR